MKKAKYFLLLTILILSFIACESPFIDLSESERLDELELALNTLGRAILSIQLITLTETTASNSDNSVIVEAGLYSDSFMSATYTFNNFNDGVSNYIISSGSLFAVQTINIDGTQDLTLTGQLKFSGGEIRDMQIDSTYTTDSNTSELISRTGTVTADGITYEYPIEFN